MYRRRRKLWNLGRRSLTRLLLLGTSTTRKVTKVHRARYTIPFPSLDNRLLDNQGSGIVQDLDVLFTLSTTGNCPFLIFLHGGQPYVEEDKVSNIYIYIYIQKEEWTILTSTSGLLMSKVFNNRLRTKSPSR